MSNGHDIDVTEDIKHLRAVELKLLDINEGELNQDEKNKLAKQLNDCSVLIRKLEQIDLQELLNKFKSRELALRQAAKKLEDDLEKLDDVVQILDVTAASLGTIKGIVALLP